MKQSRDNSCLACVLAKIVGESEQYVLDWFENQDPPFGDEDAYLFLAHHGVFLSLYCKLKKPMKIDEVDVIPADIPIKGRPIYFVVESQRFDGKHHAIFWDGHKVIDSNPSVINTKLSDYKVIGFYPLMQTEQREKFFNKRQLRREVVGINEKISKIS